MQKNIFYIFSLFIVNFVFNLIKKDMKSNLKILMVILLFLSATTLNAQITKQSSEIKKDKSSNIKKDSKQVKTHSIIVKFHCANGKALIERELLKKEGVISASANLETKDVEIKYNPKLVTEENLLNTYMKLAI